VYLDFFQLQRMPFHVTPDPTLFYPLPGHREALSALLYGVELRKGFIALTGEVGVGKTTILRSFLERIDREQTQVIYLLNADVSFDDLLQTLLQELDAVPVSESAFMRVQQLHRVLIDQFHQGWNVVLIVDEAQNMPPSTLEGLRVLSNLETETDKLLQIIFCGQPEFDDKLARAELRQLQQRIAVRATLMPLTEAEGIRYIQYRLNLAGAADRVIFTPVALKRIVKEARGIPRLINILCDNALVTAYGYQEWQVKSRVVREVIADRKVRTHSQTRDWRVPAVGVAAATMVAGLFLSGADFGLLQGVQPSPLEARRPLLQLPPPIVDSPAAPTQVVSPLTPSTSTSSAVGQSTPFEKPSSDKEDEQESVTKIVEPGDRLIDLVEEVYGARNERLVQRVQRYNPQISNINLINVGDHLVFPPADNKGLKR
jgi:general secretion pathway protein A